MELPHLKKFDYHPDKQIVKNFFGPNGVFKFDKKRKVFEFVPKPDSF
jgi:hypothetical protein